MRGWPEVSGGATVNEPFPWLVRRAELHAHYSNCSKSRRGVVIFDRSLETRRIAKKASIGEGETFGSVANLIVISEGYNRPPGTHGCDGSDRCKEDCAKRCIHAEEMAIFAAGDRARGMDLLHVKVVNNRAVPGGGPSCWQCSKLVLEAGLAGVWLWEGDSASSAWRFYSAKDFHEATLQACGIHPYDKKEPCLSG